MAIKRRIVDLAFDVHEGLRSKIRKNKLSARTSLKVWILRKPVAKSPGHALRVVTRKHRKPFRGLRAHDSARHDAVTDHCSQTVYAQFFKELSDIHFPDAEKTVLVQDIRHPHTTEALYATSLKKGARCIADGFGLTRRLLANPA